MEWTDRPQEEAGQPQAEPRGSELDLFAFLMLQRRHLQRTLVLGGLFFLATVTWMLVVKPRYSSTAVLLVPQANPTAAGLALQMAGGLDLIGGGFEVYADILKSRTVADRLIASNGLLKVFHTREMAVAERQLVAMTVVMAAKEGLIRVTVESQDPKLAAKLANDYLAELDRMNQGLAMTSAAQQRVYFERQLVKEKDALADAEVALKQAQERTGIVVPTAEAQADLSATESTRAQLRARQIELNGLSQSATAQNADVVRLRAEVAGLEGQLSAMQKGGGGLATGLAAARAPEAILLYTRLAREVKFHETLFELIEKQYETAKAQEAKDVSMIEILDPAIPALHKSWPPRTLYCLLGLLGGVFVGLVYTGLEAFVAAVLSNPENQARYREFRGIKAADSTRGAVG